MKKAILVCFLALLVVSCWEQDVAVEMEKQAKKSISKTAKQMEGDLSEGAADLLNQENAILQKALTPAQTASKTQSTMAQ